MSKMLKIFLAILSSAFIAVVFNCIYGFTVGGQKNVTYYCLCITVSILLSLGILAVINGREYINEKHKGVLIAVTLGLLVSFSVLYNPLNALSKSTSFAEYQTEIVYIGGRKSLMFDDVTFLDRNKNEITTLQLNELISFDDKLIFEEGKVITVREYEGGFGFPVYELLP